MKSVRENGEWQNIQTRLNQADYDLEFTIGIYDKRRKCAYMIHEANAASNKNLPEILQTIQKQVKLRI